MIIFLLSLLVAVLLEITFSSLPFTVIVLILMLFFKKDDYIYYVFFIVGFLMDILLLRNLGLTSFFYLCTIGVVYLYRRKFETTSFPFVVFISFFSSFFYLLMFSDKLIFLQSVFSMFVSIISFMFAYKYLYKKKKNYLYKKL